VDIMRKRKSTITERMTLDTESIKAKFKSRWIFDTPLVNLGMKDSIRVKNVDEYLDRMKLVREKAHKNNLVPLFHYTSLSVLPLILEGGLRMSTQGQGDGGVYFSLKSPLSYGLGTPQYEENIIKDCFGVERVQEYLGKGKLDVLVVYGCEANVLTQAPGGRDNAKMVPKSYFTSLMLPQESGDYFLRSDRILAVFIISNDNVQRILATHHRDDEVEAEVQKELQTREDLDDVFHLSNAYARELVKVAARASSSTIAADRDIEVGSGNTGSYLMSLGEVYKGQDSDVKSTSSHLHNNEDGSGGVIEAITTRRLSDNPLFRPRNATLDGNPSNVGDKGNRRRFNSTIKLKPINSSEIEMEEFSVSTGITEI
jgi:hypothetical protein